MLVEESEEFVPMLICRKQISWVAMIAALENRPFQFLSKCSASVILHQPVAHKANVKLIFRNPTLFKRLSIAINRDSGLLFP